MVVVAPNPDFVLASASPRRVELLRQIGAEFIQQPVDIDETPGADKSPADYVVRLAREKALAVDRARYSLPVLGSDTTVVLGGEPIGKPRDEEHAVTILRSLAGRRHQVLTAVAMTDGARCEWRLSETDVLFGDITEAQCRRYWATGEPADKAGAYAIQGFGAVFVKAISGSYSGVVGLPLAETKVLFDLFNVSYWKHN